MTQGPTQISNQLDAEARRADPDDFADDLKPGTTLLGGQYRILGFLNSGGFGITYLAKDSVDRTVVIKECFPNALCRRSQAVVRARSRKHQTEYRSFVENFVNEAKSLARLVHPNIVGVHQVFEDNDTAYMAIDYIDGRDLHDVLASTDQPFTPAETVVLLKKMLGAVEFIHQVGILHRDISPDNILIDKSGNPILIDFGAASEEEARSARVLTGRRVIKEGYSPQEFYMAGAQQSPSSDLYSLGATFFHVITGKAPPESQRRLARVAEGNADPYEPLAGRYKGYPRGFLESVDTAMQVLPKNRIQSASDWLEWIRLGETGGALPYETKRPITQKVHTRPVTAAAPPSADLLSTGSVYLIVAGVVLALAGLGGLWSYMN
ncbi:serine/threonine-protein kinase [Tabrizicola sp.]|uniref:serine/threonine-protein kinase n=1 Tax=Tabrizicola sp. TaxID=2005166 RepID=UPI003F306BB3